MGKAMKKVFISQPMNGLSNEEIQSLRDTLGQITLGPLNTDEATVLKRNEEGGFQVIDSFFKDAPHDAKPLWFLGKSFELLSEADIVIFGPGWDKARGCKMEHEAAAQYLSDKVIIEMDETGKPFSNHFGDSVSLVFVSDADKFTK